MWLPAIVAVVGSLSTVMTAMSLWRLSEARTRHRFEIAASRVTDQINDHLRAYIALLHGGAGLFSGSESVTPEEFSRFAARMRVAEEYPGALGIGFLRRLANDAQVAEFEKMMRDRHGAKFQITPEAKLFPERSPVEFIEPQDRRNAVVLGWDLWSDDTRREALARARDTGQAAGTAGVTLKQEIDADKQLGFLIFVPVYSTGDVPASIDDRRRTISGYIFSPFRMNDLMDQLLKRGGVQELATTISELRPDGGMTEMYSSHEGLVRLEDGLVAEPVINVAGRRWTIRTSALRGFRDASAGVIAWTTGALGLLLTSSLVIMAFAQARARQREGRASAMLTRSEERYRTLVAATASIVWSSDADGNFIEPQTSWEAFTGHPWETHHGRGWLESIHASDRERLEAAWVKARMASSTFEEEGRIWSQATRGYRWFIMRGVPMLRSDGSIAEWVGLVRDIQERRHLEENLLQSRKLESLGRLAGGVAHDFNNLLTAIIGSADLAAMDGNLGPATREYLRTIRDAAERSGVLTRHLLSFARKQVIEPRNVSINDLVRRMTPILERVLGENVKLLTSLPGETGLIRIDPGQFEQVLVNLATNARDAMPGGGVLTLQTSNAELNQDYARTHEGVNPGTYIMLLISDTGVGMDAAVQQHIFEPFFTTKEAGKGTGLGLATCYGIIRQAGGFIWVYSEPGKGTLFRIFFPRADGVADSTILAPDDALPFGNECILVVEDEPMVRQIAAAALRGFGYSVLSAGSGEEAMAIANAYAGDIHLIVTDVVLPQMSGKELADKLRAVRPSARVLYCSGYTDAVISHHGVLDQGIAFLQKPYTPRQLARKVRGMLDAAGPRPGK